MIKPNKILILSGVGLLSLGAGYLGFKKVLRLGLITRIIAVAKKFVGEREIEPNKGFFNQAFEKIMRELGNWRPGFEWCACFARMVWLMVLSGKKHEIANRLLSPSSQLTYKNFAVDKSGYFEVSDRPKPGAIVIWQYQPDPSRGHAGVFISMLGQDYIVVEGNKHQKVSICKYSPAKMLQPTNNMKLRGFINIK